MSFTTQQQWLNPDNSRTAERFYPMNPSLSPEMVSGVSANITTDVPQVVIAAPGAGKNIYVTDILVTNGHASVGTWVEIRNGATVIYKGYAAANGGGFVVNLKTPIRLSTNTALNAANVTDGSDTVVSASGYNGV